MKLTVPTLIRLAYLIIPFNLVYLDLTFFILNVNTLGSKIRLTLIK